MDSFTSLNEAFLKKPKQSNSVRPIDPVSRKIIVSVFSFLFLLGSVVTGTILVSNQQLFEQKATVNYINMQPCPLDVSACSLSPLIGTNECVHPNYSEHLFCCDEGSIIGEGSFTCTKIPECMLNASDCSEQDNIYGSKLCKIGNKTQYCCPSTTINIGDWCLAKCETGSKCSSTYIGNSKNCATGIGLGTKYCCQPGQIIANNKCMWPCKSGLSCSTSAIGANSSECFTSNTNQELFCCNDNKAIINKDGYCQVPSTIPICEPSARCGYTYSQQTTYCLKSTSTGGTYGMYCCPKDNFYTTAGCKPIPCSQTYPCSGTKPSAPPLPKPTTKPGV